MVIVRLCGGLGNQMFQYAAARRASLVSGEALKLDLEWFGNIPKGDTPRKYELDVFDTVQDCASPADIRALRGADIARWPKAAKRVLNRTGWLIRKSYIRESGYRFDPEILKLRGDLYLDGYWQSARYFEDVADSIRRDFTIKALPDAANREAARAIEGSQAISLHVRRGDYVSNPAINQYHGSSSLDYYRKAVAEIMARVADPHFFVFSDEPQWVKENLKLEAPVTYIGHNGPDKGYEDLRLMTLCRHHIIANSSFSWWGAWLSTAPDGTVVAPKKWFNDEAISTEDLIPKGWMRL